VIRIHYALKSSRAAIDLASIMVGIIVIGLIGGVIAATVFAVIPWSQDKAAKQQLDSVASAQSAYRGLSTSKDASLQDASTSPTSQTDPNQVVLNSTFTGSTGLAKNNLLALNTAGNYCAIATTDGKDYHAYSKSGSGKWFYITSGKTQPSEYLGTIPCVVSDTTPVGPATQPAGTVDVGVDDGLGDVPTKPVTTTPGSGSGTTPVTTPSAPATTPAAPTYFASWDFENQQAWTPYSSTEYALVLSNNPHSGTYSMALNNGANTMSWRAKAYPSKAFVSGKQYKITAWMYNTGDVARVYMGIGPNEYTVATKPALSTWTQVSITATYNSGSGFVMVGSTTSGLGAKGATYWDDITVEQLN
jgi:type II secretory pathway pseudopilin PulG